MAQSKEISLKTANGDRKRNHSDAFAFDVDGSAVWSAESTESGDPITLFDSEPSAKRPKLMGRPPRPEIPCEHGSTSKKCQKCLYRLRQSKVR